MKSLPVHNKSFSYVIGFHSIMSSYLSNTKLLASCLKCGRVVSATPYYTLWDKTTPSHINSSFLEQYCNFRLLYLPSFLPFISPDRDPILIRNLPSSCKKCRCFNWYNRIWSLNLKKKKKKSDNIMNNVCYQVITSNIALLVHPGWSQVSLRD